MDFARALDILGKYKTAGLSTFRFFLGLPGGTKDTLHRTLAFAMAAPLDYIHAGLCTPYPGTAIFIDLEAKGLLHHRWREYRHFSAFPVSSLSAKYLKRFLRLFYWRFYSRPRHAWLLIREMWLSGFAGILRVAWTHLRNKKLW
jgi:radical SAM superfamily enzyme YgiQ (UPF0313 family)